MGFFKKLFSSDNRAAIAAEAAGDFELAAKLYALAGRNDAAVRMHLARADRAKSRGDEVDALRDALHWAQDDPELQGSASMALGKALLAQAQAEGVKTERDRERVRESADLLLRAECFEHAGDAFITIDDDVAAAAAYKNGGLVAKMEQALGREQSKRDRARSERSGFADYDLHMRGGSRDEALDCLRDCLQNADSKSRYRRLLDELESRLITGGRVVLKNRHGLSVGYCAVEEILIGRDSLCDLVLRTGGVSRRHASIFVVTDRPAGDRTQDGTANGTNLRFEVGDAGSRNGTRMGGLEIESQLPLIGSGTFQLGDHAEIHFSIENNSQVLHLDIRRGIDKGSKMLATGTGLSMSLEDFEIDAQLSFREGRPILEHQGSAFALNGESLSGGSVQLIHSDVITIDGIEIEVG